MAEKRVSVRLVAVGGKQVEAVFEGIGASGKRNFGTLSEEMAAANLRVAAFFRRAAVATGAAVVSFGATAAAAIKSGLATVDAQAKLAQSLGTTVASIQTLERAGELAGVSMSGVEQATKDLTRRLSQAAAGGGPAVKALKDLHLSAVDMAKLPLDERLGDASEIVMGQGYRCRVDAEVMGTETVERALNQLARTNTEIFLDTLTQEECDALAESLAKLQDGLKRSFNDQ